MLNLYKNMCQSRSVAYGVTVSRPDGFQYGATLEPDCRLSLCHQLEAGQSWKCEFSPLTLNSLFGLHVMEESSVTTGDV